jgi:hypothetical protein
MATRRIGELLVAEGLLTEAAVNRALGFQRLSVERVKLGTILLNWELLAEDTLLAALSKLHGCPPVTWELLGAARVETVRLLAANHAARIGAIPYSAEKSLLHVAFVNPSDIAGIDEVAALTGRRVAAGVTTEVRMLQAQQRFYGRHIPLEFRAISQKLDRRTAETRRAAQSERDSQHLDIGAPNDAQISETAPGNLSVSVPIREGSRADDAAGAEIPTITVPEIPLPEPPAPVPTQPMQPTERLEIFSGDDSLSTWVGEALSALSAFSLTEGSEPSEPRPVIPASAPPPAARRRRRTDSSRSGSTELRSSGSEDAPSIPSKDGIPQTIPPFRRADDPVADMWRPEGEPNPADSVASRMWTTADAAGEDAELRAHEQVGSSILDSLLTELPRVILFGAGKDTIAAWSGRGEDLSPKALRTLRIPSTDPSIFSVIQETGTPHYGPLEKEEWPRALAAVLGAKAPECAIFPIRVFDSVAGFLYADRMGSAMQYDDFARMARSAATAANVLSRFFQRKSAAPVQ